MSDIPLPIYLFNKEHPLKTSNKKTRIYKVILVIKPTTRSMRQALSQKRTLSANTRVWGQT